MCLCHQAVQFGTGQRAVMLCGREGNCRSGVALAMRHRLVVYPPKGSMATEREMSNPPTIHTGAWSALPLHYITRVKWT